MDMIFSTVYVNIYFELANLLMRVRVCIYKASPQSPVNKKANTTLIQYHYDSVLVS